MQRSVVGEAFSPTIGEVPKTRWLAVDSCITIVCNPETHRPPRSIMPRFDLRPGPLSVSLPVPHPGDACTFLGSRHCRQLANSVFRLVAPRRKRSPHDHYTGRFEEAQMSDGVYALRGRAALDELGPGRGGRSSLFHSDTVGARHTCSLTDSHLASPTNSYTKVSYSGYQHPYYQPKPILVSFVA
jgi:hypothetical protein